MTTYKMTDGAYFSPAMLDGAQAVACYLGGANAFRTWTFAELTAAAHLPRLPIWVPPAAASATQATTDLYAILGAMLHYGIPRGQTIAFDLEMSKADVTYMTQIAHDLHFFGYGAIGYGSLSTITAAVPSYLWKWDADWTGQPHLTEGMQATQWTDGARFDTSEISEELYATLLWKAP